MTAKSKRMPEPDERVGISLYEFYAIGIERLLVKAPWELERSVSAYHQSFLTEQRCIGLAILLLMGEDHVLSDEDSTLPGFEEQVRRSKNQAIFLRALRTYFQQNGIDAARGDQVLEHMQSYLADSRAASDKKGNPLKAMVQTVVRRVPPQTDEQYQKYTERVEKIYDYIEGLVEKSLLKRYEVSS